MPRGGSGELTLAAVVDALEAEYPLDWAEDWDRVGLVVGEEHAPVRSVLLAVDPTVAVVAEAMEKNCDLLITHHPLLLRPVSFLPASTGKGRVVTELIRSQIALWCGHTNVDRSHQGTVGAWIAALDLQDAQPLASTPSSGDTVNDGGALFGLGAVGSLPEATTVEQLARTISSLVPATAQGIRFTGAGDRTVCRIAVCPGAGDSFLPAAADADVDVYITSDLRHHTALEHLESAGEPGTVPALIDVAHFASEGLWLPLAQRLLQERFAELEVLISTVSTDPWSGRV